MTCVSVRAYGSSGKCGERCVLSVMVKSASIPLLQYVRAALDSRLFLDPRCETQFVKRDNTVRDMSKKASHSTNVRLDSVRKAIANIP